MAVGTAAASGFTEREGGQVEIRGPNELDENSRPGVRATGATLASVVMVAGAFFDAGAVIAHGVLEAGVTVEAEANEAGSGCLPPQVAMRLAHTHPPGCLPLERTVELKGVAA
jgi:hypothetical protein